MSGDSAEDDLSAIAWPGFVDILSSVIIMFVFFVMIVATALFFHVIIYKSKILAEIEAQIQAQTENKTRVFSEAIKVLEKQVQVVTKEKEVLENIVSEYEQEFYQTRAEFTESENQDLIYDQDKNEITIFFGRHAISVTEDIQTKLKDAIADYTAKFGKDNVSVRLESSINPGFEIKTTAKQVAVSRMFNVRNVFIDAEFPPKKLRPALVEGKEINETYHWVRVIFKKDE